MNQFYIPKKAVTDHWYREPWMLLVLGGPLIVVIAAVFTFYLAWHDSDNVLSRDYYRQGINIDKDIRRDANAAEHRMQASISLAAESGKIIVHVEGNTSLPDTLQLTLSAHARGAEYEAMQKIKLIKTGKGEYEGHITVPSANDKASLNLWHVKIEDQAWRLTSEWKDPLHQPLLIKP